MAVKFGLLFRGRACGLTLQKSGWLERRPDPNYGRCTFATLTDDGFKALEEAAPTHVTFVRQLVFDPLTKAQVGQLARITSCIPEASDGGQSDN